ncbi:hypothetical protein DLAC_04308 [Tieghemostelium lacteum]|uniref:Uncharacterized protein n=1 Tax=Tieghemostelium lacteum TaxID=361077 RepID=A0A151ZJP6_TIELA|nr:hypothetical protein DLAC_04308 [Tieghemostelium lacteum]|eukprot:KYQ94034.1 hypothetical protein DLAC_04308 [Tieghemostelium lacteum]
MIDYKFIALLIFVIVPINVVKSTNLNGYIFFQNCDIASGVAFNTTGTYIQLNYCLYGYTYTYDGSELNFYGPSGASGSGSSGSGSSSTGTSDTCSGQILYDSFSLNQCDSNGNYRSYLPTLTNPVGSYVEDFFASTCTDSSEDNSSGESDLVYRYFAEVGKCVYNVNNDNSNQYTRYGCVPSKEEINIEYFSDEGCTQSTDRFSTGFTKSCKIYNTLLMYCSN